MRTATRSSRESLAQAFFNTPEIDEANGIDPLLRPWVLISLKRQMFTWWLLCVICFSRVWWAGTSMKWTSSPSTFSANTM